MSKHDQKRYPNRSIAHCLRCHKPQKKLPVHLAQSCMRSHTPEERAEEVEKAKASSREWIRKNRTWNYRELCQILPDRRSRILMVKELLRRGFFIINQPPESDMILDPDPATADVVTADVATADVATEDVATTVTPSTYPALTTTSSVRIKMKEAGLHGKFPAHAKLLVGFKKYLIKSRKIPNWQTEVDNLSRFLRYVLPKAREPSLDFLSKRKETQDFLKALRCADMRAASIFNYIKSIVRFLEYLVARLDLQKKDPQLQTKCQSFTAMLKNLRKTVYDDKPCDTSFSHITLGIKNCQKILQVAKPDFLRIHGNLLKGAGLSNTDKTLYRYYCEALLVFHHMQRPGAVKAFTDADWVDRFAQGGRVVIGVRSEKSSMQIALLPEEEACFQLYYKHIRPVKIGLEKFCQSFFVSMSGENVHAVSRDMTRLHEIYKLPPVTSQEMRRAVGGAARQLPAHQQVAVSRYMTESRFLVHSAGAAQAQDIVDAAVLLDSLTGTYSHDTLLAELSISMEQTASRKDFFAFVAKFPVSLNGQPPSRTQRIESGFPDDRTFYDKWRATQLTQREEYLLSHFTHHKPSAAKVLRLIAKEGWKANSPKPEEIERLWKPPPADTIETNQVIIKCVSEQAWTGLVIKDFGPEQGLGVVATRPFSKGDIVCDYHGTVITAAEGRAMMQGFHDEARYLFFFRAGDRDMCIDAQNSPCECHPNSDTIGRRIKRSSERPNLEPLHCVLNVNGEDQDVILFKAMQDISIDTELKFYSGVIIKSFLGLDLDWLDE